MPRMSVANSLTTDVRAQLRPRDTWSSPAAPALALTISSPPLPPPRLGVPVAASPFSLAGSLLV
jgi:hypothetical protein